MTNSLDVTYSLDLLFLNVWFISKIIKTIIVDNRGVIWGGAGCVMAPLT
jgi:hypothetical protein